MLIPLVVVTCLVAAVRQSLTDAFAAFFDTLLRPLTLLADAFVGGLERRLRKGEPHPGEDTEVPSRGRRVASVVSEAAAENAVRVLAHFAMAIVLAGLFVVMFWADIVVNALRFIGIFGLKPGPDRIASLSKGADMLSGASLACMAATYGVFVFEMFGLSRLSFFRLPESHGAAKVVKVLAVVAFFASVVATALFFWASQLVVAFGRDAVDHRYIDVSLAFAALYGALLIGALAISGVAVGHVVYGLLLGLLLCAWLALEAANAVILGTSKVLGFAVDATATVGDVQLGAGKKVWNAAVGFATAERKDERRDALKSLRIGDPTPGPLPTPEGQS